MNLRELQAEFLKIEGDGFRIIQNFADADGVMFLCPVCFEKNHGEVGTESMICWQPHIPQTVNPAPGRWKFHGTSIDDLTFDNGKDEKGNTRASSVQVNGGCNAHYHVRNGQIEICK